jgi:hypothetical protein
MDEVFKTTGHMPYETECVDFYQELSLTNNITPTTRVGGNFGQRGSVFGASVGSVPFGQGIPTGLHSRSQMNQLFYYKYLPNIRVIQ